MREYVTELKVIDGKKNIFNTDLPYEIPLYQRAYAWEDKQLHQLIEDIKDVQLDSNYYIGSLIVSKNENNYEVVDGQQRLTSLFLLLNVIGKKTEKKLTFACRDKSNYTLHNIENFFFCILLRFLCQQAVFLGNCQNLLGINSATIILYTYL